MFAGHDIVLDMPFAAARTRLSRLSEGGWLDITSAQAYEDGLAGLIRVGPFGAVLGASKLVRVRLLEPVPREDQLIVPLRWEATGAMGRLFPVLDADLVLTPGDDDDHSRLALMGAYRPPLGAAGAALDRVLLSRAAVATIRSLLISIGDSVRYPDPANAPELGAGPEFLLPATRQPEPEMPW